MSVAPFYFTGDFMAQYDGSIRINTKIDSKEASAQLMTLENRIVNTSDKIASLRSKMDSLKDAKIPTIEYQNLQKELDLATKEMEKLVSQDSKLSDVDAKIKKLSQSAAEYATRMKDVAKQKIPTEEYSTAQKEVDKYSNALQRAKEKIDKLLEIGVDKKSSRFISAQYDVAQLENKLLDAEEVVKRLEQEGKAFTLGTDTEQYKNLSEKYESVNAELEKEKGIHSEIAQKQAESVRKVMELKSQMNQLVAEGKAFTLGQDTEEFAKLGQQLKYAENDMAVLNQQHEVLQLKQKKVADGYKKLGSVAKQSFNTIGKALTKANSYVNSFGKRLKDIAHRILPTFHKETKRTNTVLGQFSTRLKSLLSGMFIFNVISSYIRKMFSGINDGFENFYNQNVAFRSSVDSMRTSLLQLKNTFAAAFAPIVSVAIPYLEKLISYITKAVNSIGQLVAALLGKKTYTKAIRVNVENLENTSDALEEVKESAKDAEKALDGYLSPLDEINKYSEDKEIKVDIDTGKKPDVSDIGDTVQDMFEEVPIDNYFLNLADKVKDIFSQLFAPLKEAWNREGKFVMDSWKTALKEVGDLLKSIGSDFLEVWQQEKTIKIFEDLLHIIGDIGLVVGNLAHNFRLAWEENETGKRILEGIRDIIGVIVANIRHAADVTVEWAKNLDFTPLLTAIKGWVESLVPVFDNLSGIITDFYEKVILPLGKWVLEKGLPDLLQVFIDFNNKVDWEALRKRLAQFWEHLEPFAETVGEGLILFIERCANALADFINSPAFDDFLTMIENWMDSVSPEDVADALEAIGKAIIYLKGAVIGFSAISKGLTILSSFIKILEFFGAGGGASKALSGLKSIGSAIAGWAPHIAVGAAIVDVIKRIKEAVSERIDTSGFGLTDWISETLKLSLEGWKSEFENFKISLELWWQDSWMSDKIWKFGQWWNKKVAPWFTKEKWSGLWSNISESLSAKWQDVVNSWNETKEKLAEKWNEIKDNATKTFDDIKKSLSDSWSNIKETATQTWQDISKNLSEKWSGLKSGAKTTFENIKNSIKDSWINIKNNIKESAENIKTNISDTWSKVKENTSSAWSNIKEKAISAVQSMAGGISEKFGNIRELISSFSSIAQSIWSSAWEGMKNRVVSILSSIQSTISSVFGWIHNMITSLGNALRNLASSIFSFGSTSMTKTGRTFSQVSRMASPMYQPTAFDALRATPIPALARGAVIPANREFLAVLGDQKHGTNIEAPLATIEEAVGNVMAKINSSMRTGGQEITIKIPIYLEGKVIYEAVINQGKINQMSSGNNDFLLGTT